MGKTTRKMLSILITVVMVMTCMPVNGLLNADSTVYHIYSSGDGDDITGYIAETETPAEGVDYEYAGVYVTGGSYVIPDDFPEEGYLILNNSEATGITDGMFPVLLGNSKISGDSVEYVSNNNLVYNRDITFSELYAYALGVLDTWAEEKKDYGYSIPSNYTMTVTGNMTLDEPLYVKNLVVNSDATLTVSGSGCELDVDQLTLNGTINITAPTGGTDPNGMRIRETAAPGENADLTAAEGSVLRIDEGASVPGMAPGEYHYQGSDWVPAGGGGDVPVPASGMSMRFALPAGLLSKAEVSLDAGGSYEELVIQDYEEPGNEQFILFTTSNTEMDNVQFRLTPKVTGKRLTAYVMVDHDNSGHVVPFDENEYGLDETATILTINRGNGWGAYYDIFLDTEHFEAQFHFDPGVLSKIEFAFDGSGTYE